VTGSLLALIFALAVLASVVISAEHGAQMRQKELEERQKDWQA
jgi:hypothetical protein